MASHTEGHIYHPKDAISGAVKTTMYTGGVGLFASAVQNTLLRQNVGPWGIFVRSGGTIGIMGMTLWDIRLDELPWLTVMDSGNRRYL
mgnify:CR=1 FL=1